MLTDEEAVDVAEMSRLLGYSEYVVRAMARNGAIPGHKPTGRPKGEWRFYPSEVREHLTQKPGWHQSNQSRGRKRVA